MKKTITAINTRIAHLKSEIFINEMSDFLTFEQERIISNCHREIKALKDEIRANYPEWQRKVDAVEKLVYETCWHSEFRRWNYFEKHFADLIMLYANGEFDTFEDFVNMLVMIFDISYELINHYTQETLNLEDVEDTATIWIIKPTQNRRFCNQYTIELM